VRVPVASEGETRDEALSNAKEAIEASLEVKAEQLKQRTRGEKVVVIVEAASPLVAYVRALGKVGFKIGRQNFSAGLGSLTL
jgi:cbb3-type cytochrome oxidase cytochrome c subunit